MARSLRHPYPILEPAVIRHRAVALADVSSLAFFCGFGALVLGGVLFLTGVWHESVLRAGFLIAPGPLLAGLTAFPGGLLGGRIGHRAVGTAGSLFFAAGGLWWVLHVERHPGLGRRLPAGQPARRLRRRPHAALARRRGHRAAATAALRHRLRPLRHDAARSASRSAWPASSPSSGRPPGPPPCTAFHHAWIFMIGCSLAGRRRPPGHRHRRADRGGRRVGQRRARGRRLPAAYALSAGK